MVDSLDSVPLSLLGEEWKGGSRKEGERCMCRIYICVFMYGLCVYVCTYC